jgi:hypothetical protein
MKSNSEGNNAQQVANEKVRSEKRHLDDLHHKLPSRLRHGVCAQSVHHAKKKVRQHSLKQVKQVERDAPPAVPPTSPPSPVRLIVLELSAKQGSDEELEDKPLDGDPVRYDTHKTLIR